MKRFTARSAVAAATLTLANAARAAGDATGTDAVGEAPVTGSMFFMLIGGILGLGVVIWLVTKVISK